MENSISFSVFSDRKTQSEFGAFIRGFSGLESRELVAVQASAGPTGLARSLVNVVGTVGLVAKALTHFAQAKKKRLVFEVRNGDRMIKIDATNHPFDEVVKLIEVASGVTLEPMPEPAETPDKVIEGFARKPELPKPN